MLSLKHELGEVSVLSLNTFFVEPRKNEICDDCLADEGASQIDEDANVDPGSEVFECLWLGLWIDLKLSFGDWNFHRHHVERDRNGRVIWREDNCCVKCKDSEYGGKEEIIGVDRQAVRL